MFSFYVKLCHKSPKIFYNPSISFHKLYSLFFPGAHFECKLLIIFLISLHLVRCKFVFLFMFFFC